MNSHSDPAAAATPSLDALADAFDGLFAAQRRLRGRDAMVVDGISFAQFRLLRALARDGSMPASRLAEATAITPSSATQMLDALEGRGLVKRTRSLTDRRVVTIELTAEGERRADARRAQQREGFERAFADLSDAELAAGAEILRRYEEYLDSL